MDEDYQQLLVLRETTKLTGFLHEAQKTQLKYWPLMFTHATKCSFSHNFDNKTLIFDIEQTQGRTPKDLDKRLDFLAKCVHELLGDEYEVRVNLKGELIYDGKGVVNGRREEVSKKNKPGLNKQRTRRVSKVAARRAPADPARRRSKDV